MGDTETIARHKRAARELAAESDVFDAGDLRVCVECGKTVIHSQNIFSDRADSNYCPCDGKGVPMVSPVGTAMGDDSDDAESPDAIPCKACGGTIDLSGVDGESDYYRALDAHIDEECDDG